MERIRLQCLTVIFLSNPSQSARAPEIYRHGKEHRQKRGPIGLDVDVLEEQSFDGFVNDDETSDQQQAGLDERRKVLNFSVPILTVGVCRLVRYAHREKRDRGSDQIQSRVRRFRQDPQTAGGNSDNDFQRSDRDCRKDRIGVNGALLCTHCLPAEDGRSSRHVCIIALARGSAKPERASEPTLLCATILVCPSSLEEPFEIVSEWLCLPAVRRRCPCPVQFARPGAQAASCCAGKELRRLKRKLQHRRSGCSSHYGTRPLRTACGRQRNSVELQDSHHAASARTDFECITAHHARDAKDTSSYSLSN